MSLARAAYRSRQFFASLGARLSPAERQTIAAHLTPAQQRLFSAMTVRDQRHSLDVLQALQRMGCQEEEVLLAALLHDVGKGSVRLWHRVAYVLLQAASPRLLDRLAQPNGPALSLPNGRGWRWAIAAIRDHGARGAALAEAAGASAAVVELIRHHQRACPELAEGACPEGSEGADGSDRRVALLRAADESC